MYFNADSRGAAKVISQGRKPLESLAKIAVSPVKGETARLPPLQGWRIIFSETQGLAPLAIFFRPYRG